jgi:type VI secretion system secreted protein Hcp
MAAVDYFLKIDGVDGESQDQGHKGEIEVLSWSWGESQAGQVAHGGGGGAGKVTMQDFHFTMRSSKASPKLFLACATGQHIKQAVLVGRKAGDKPQEYLKYKLTDILVSSYQIGGSNGGDSPSDQISLNFARLEVEYRTQNPDGSLGSPVSAGWDLKMNRSV